MSHDVSSGGSGWSLVVKEEGPDLHTKSMASSRDWPFRL